MLRGGSLLGAVLASGALTSGCFNADRLIAARRDAANGYKLAEVDLGEFHVTLPKLPGAEGGGVVEFHLFGQVANRDKSTVIEQIELRQPELRYRVLLSVRNLDQQRIDEPRLSKLRESMAKVVNEMLGEELIQSVGFFRFAYRAL
jgi:hypothetical protein